MSDPRYAIGIDLGTTHSALSYVDLTTSDGEKTQHGVLAIPQLTAPGTVEDLALLPTHPEWQSLFDTYGALPRHASQLYELALEGVVLFLILNLFIRKPRPTGSVSGLFLIGYGLFRIIVEFFRQPDAQFTGGWVQYISMGQILSIPMVLAGIIMMVWAYRHRPQQQNS